MKKVTALFFGGLVTLIIASFRADSLNEDAQVKIKVTSTTTAESMTKENCRHRKETLGH